MTAAAMRSTASRSPTSQSSCSAPISSATAASRSLPRATSTHSQPRAVSRRASAAPMPLEPPVTTATGTCVSAADANDAVGLGLAPGRVGDDGRQRVPAAPDALRLPLRLVEPLVASPDSGDLAPAVVDAD